jgi:M6 family metalloprotease-like protein
VIIDELMNAYNDTIDFSDFDFNNDGTLDGLYMIYNHPAEGWNSFWWAYLYEYFGDQRFDDVEVSSYVWMPYELMVVNNQIDASTIIHETGHKLGIEDYYDYASDDGSNNEWGLGGADMMDSTVGDHNPFSKLLLGWIQPKVVTESMDLTLNPFSTSGDAYIITDDWNGSLFDEYIIAMYYTPTGLYQGFDDFFFDGQSGMILYHVDARLGPNSSANYPTYFLNNNTDSNFKLIRFIEADGNNSLYDRDPQGWMWGSDVFRPGAIFGSTNNSGYAWNQASRGQVPFTIRVNEEATGVSELTISVRF